MGNFSVISDNAKLLNKKLNDFVNQVNYLAIWFKLIEGFWELG